MRLPSPHQTIFACLLFLATAMAAPGTTRAEEAATTAKSAASSDAADLGESDAADAKPHAAGAPAALAAPAAPAADSELDSVDRYLLSMLAGFSGPENPLGMTLTNDGELVPAQGGVLMPVQIHIPIRSISFVAADADGEHTGDADGAPKVRADMEVRLVAKDANGDRSPVRRSPFNVVLDRHRLEAELDKDYVYPLQLLATVLEQTIAVAVADKTTGSVSFDTIRLVAPAADDEGKQVGEPSPDNATQDTDETPEPETP